MTIFFEIIILICTYLIGSFPTGYYLTKKYKGVNIQKHGSGNIGSTNVKRVAGKKLSIITQLIDMLKGLVPVGLTMYFTSSEIISLPSYYIYLVALTSIIGHNFSIFLNFSGGKGVNTTLGSSLLILPLGVFYSVLVYYLVKWKTGYVSFASLCLSATLLATSIIIYDNIYEVVYFTAVFLLVVIRHKSNISRLIRGTEPKVNF